MKCHYEVLELGKEADESEIKTAYRKLALKWHPDKNLNDAEHAKEQFQLIQQAYEVLSDRQERAWYDNHREQILRGNDSSFSDDAFDVYPFFTTTCFRGYTDEENGFYTVYRKVFENISKEDMEYMDKQEFIEIPCFGTSTSDYDNVVASFYAYWMAYKTKKSYVWLDPYSINETRNRKVFKLMEKENKKVREKAQKERNEEVRALVGFVRKRDKRVQEYSKKLEMKILENRRKQEELSKQKRLERKKQIDEWQSQAEWSKFDNVKTELEQIERSLAREFGETWPDDEIEDEYENDTDNLYCVACNKVFRSPKSFKNHESSKKHKENVDKLKSCVMKDIEDMDLSEENEELLNNSDVDLLHTEPSNKQKKKQRKSKNVINNVTVSDDDLAINKEICDMVKFEDDCSFERKKKQKRKSTKNVSKIIKESNNHDTDTVEKHLQNGEDDCPIEINNQTKVGKGKGKKNQKEADTLETNNVKNLCCVTCKANFPSKNKLFEHLKKTGHSVHIPPSASKTKKK